MSIQSRMPPFRFSTRLNPTDRRKSAALALRAAHLALHDDLVVRDPARRSACGISPSGISVEPGDPVDLVLVRLAHVDDRQRVAAVEPLLQLDGRDLGGAWFTATGSGRGGRDAAELLVVDQLA